jgi:uncharacterized phage-associated protein
MQYSSKAIANKFLELSRNENLDITQMKLQKLVYISHGFCLAILNKPLISDDIQAWQYGPIIPELYNEFKPFGKSPIKSLATNMYVDDDLEIIKTPVYINKNDNEINDLLETIWEKYKRYNGIQLSNMTHQDNTPWHQTYKNGIPNQNIKNDVIKRYYISLIEDKS